MKKTTLLLKAGTCLLLSLFLVNCKQPDGTSNPVTPAAPKTTIEQETLINDETFTEGNIPEYYSFYGDAGTVVSGWLANNVSGNAPVDSSAITIDFSKTEKSISQGDTLYVDFTMSNGNYSSVAGVEVYLNDELVGYTDPISGKGGNVTVDFSESITVPASNDDAYNLYIKVTNNASQIRIKNVLIKKIEGDPESVEAAPSYEDFVTLIEKTSYTSDSTLPDYYVFPGTSEINSNGWICNTGTNLAAGDTALTIDLSSISEEINLKEGDKLSISFNVSNGNYGSNAAFGAYVDETEIQTTEAFKGNGGNVVKTIKTTSFILPEADDDGYQLYVKVAEGSARLYIQDIEIKLASLISE